MVPKLKDLLDLLEELVPAELAEAWDNPGVQVGFLDQAIGKVVLSLDPTPQAVQYSLSEKAQLLITHHPLIFKPIKNIIDGEYPGAVVCEAIRGGLSIVAMHTNLDIAKRGINSILAGLLGLKEISPLCEAMPDKDNRGSKGVQAREVLTGIGRIGTLQPPLPFPEFISKVKKLLGLSVVRVVNKKNLTVNKVAVVGGSGGSLIKEAWRKGADVLVTGDVTYHQGREADFLGLAVIDSGHFPTERLAFRIFGRQLQEEIRRRDWKVAVLFNEEETDPLVPM